MMMKIFSIVILLSIAIIAPFLDESDCTASIMMLVFIAAIILGDEGSKNKRRRK